MLTLRKIILATTLLLPLLAAACNTMQGLGEDVESGGHSLARAADSAK